MPSTRPTSFFSAPKVESPPAPFPVIVEIMRGSEFGPKRAEAPGPAVVPPPKESLPFEGHSTYQQEFVAKRGETAEVAYVPVARPVLPFEGTSRYQEDFVPKQGERFEYSSAPPAAPKLPFEGQSSYRAEFVPKQVPAPAAVEVMNHKVWCKCDVYPSVYCQVQLFLMLRNGVVTVFAENQRARSLWLSRVSPASPTF